MALWTLALLLAACGLVPATANSVEFIEGPVLLRFNQFRTVVRCSIEVEGGVRPRIDFYIDDVPAHISPYLSCNSESVLRYKLENGSVARECEGSNEQTRIHQALFIRTCSSDPSSFNTITIQCRVHSDIDPTVNGTASSRMNLTYNQRREPRLDPQPGEPVKFLHKPVCPGEDLGKVSLESLPPTASSTSAVVVPSSSQSYAQPTATTSLSGLPHTPTVTNVTPLDQLGEGQLKLIIYVATGVAAFFALLVVCLVFVLCCIVLKKHRILKAAPLRQGRREAVALGLSLGLTEDDKVLPVANNERGSGSPESTAHQLALHRSSGSSQSGSIHSSDGDEEQAHVRTSVEVRDGHPEMGRTIPSSFPNPLSLHREPEDHDYDYIDNDQPVPNRKENDVVRDAMHADTRARKKNTYVPEYETQPLYLSVSDAGSDSSAPFPTALFVPSSMERNTLSPALQSPVPRTTVDPTPRKQQDYVNRPAAHDYVNNRHPSHDYVNDNNQTGAVYLNSLMFGAEVHDYKNHQQPDSKVQPLVDMSALTDSYQELNTVGSTTSLTADPHVGGHYTQYTASSHLETYSLDLQHAEACRKAGRDMGALTHGSEQVYHTLYPSDGDIASSSSSDYSLPHNAAALRSATVEAPSHYDTLQAVNSGRVTHVPMKKTSAPSARRDSDYTDLEPTNMDGSSEYSTLSGTVTVNISTQTYGTSTA